MNINQLKAFFDEKPQHLGDKSSLQNQLRDSGLKQAAENQSNFVSLRSDKFSSSATFGVQVFSSALSNSLEVNSQKPDFSRKGPAASESSLFDFEEVAKNVLNFVGGAIKNAQNKGADEQALNALFEQATSGVLRGIKLAEKDLSGFLNEEIETGIASSKQLIDQGIAKLRQEIFNPEATQSEVANVESVQASYLKAESGELTIRTNDGDRVNIRFEDLQAFQASQQQLASRVEQQESAADIPPTTASTPQQAQEPLTEGALGANETLAAEPARQPQNLQAATPEQSQSDSVEEPLVQEAESENLQSAVFFQQQSLSFSVRGELDEEELKAIGQLVNDANSLAEEFFNGDIETAFNQALELGFDEQELAGFALQLTKVENTQVIKAYENISRYDEQSDRPDEASQAAKPIANYVDKLLDVFDQATRKLEDKDAYDSLIADLINRLGDEVATPDLISAINRFNGFNQQLLDNLPPGFQPKA